MKRLIVFALLAVGCFAETQKAKRLFIEDKVVTTHSNGSVQCNTSPDTGTGSITNCYTVGAGSRTRDVKLAATKVFTEHCEAVSVTDNRDAADYILKISGGSSVLYKQGGDVAYISPAKFRMSNLVKDVCKYVASH